MRRGAISSMALVGPLGLPFFVVSASRIGVGRSSCELSLRGYRYRTNLAQRSASVHLGLEGLPRIRSPDREERLLRGPSTRERAGVFSRLFVVRCRPLVTCDNAAEDTLS